MLRKFFSSRQAIRLNVGGNRASKREIADIARAQEQTHREEILRGKLATAGRVSVGKAVDQASELRVRSPQRFRFELLDDTRLFYLEIIVSVAADVFGHVFRHSADAVTGLFQNM